MENVVVLYPNNCDYKPKSKPTSTVLVKAETEFQVLQNSIFLAI